MKFESMKVERRHMGSDERVIVGADSCQTLVIAFDHHTSGRLAKVGINVVDGADPISVVEALVQCSGHLADLVERDVAFANHPNFKKINRKMHLKKVDGKVVFSRQKGDVCPVFDKVASPCDACEFKDECPHKQQINAGALWLKILKNQVDARSAAAKSKMESAPTAGSSPQKSPST